MGQQVAQEVFKERAIEDRNELLWGTPREWAQPRALAANEHDCMHQRIVGLSQTPNNRGRSEEDVCDDGLAGGGA